MWCIMAKAELCAMRISRGCIKEGREFYDGNSTKTEKENQPIRDKRV